MGIRILIFGGLLFVMALVLGGCNSIACERMADCVEEWYGESVSDADIDECVDDLQAEDYSCRKAYRSFARCLSREDCDENACYDEAEEVVDECDLDY